jgi:hypothetical protein
VETRLPRASVLPALPRRTRPFVGSRRTTRWRWCANSPPAPATRPKYSEGVIRCQSGLGEWFRASQRGVKSLKNQLYRFVPLSCVKEVMGPNSVQQHGMLSLCLIGKSTLCEHVALHNSFAILRPRTLADRGGPLFPGYRSTARGRVEIVAGWKYNLS